jgi:hypothetical protein
MRWRGVLILLAAVATALAPAPAAGAKTTWLCRPGLAANPCTPGLATTTFSPTGQQTGVVTPRQARDRGVDCFYVYPTVSDQPGLNASLAIDPEERSIALYQAARYSQVCRVWAPMYRQLTLRAIGQDPASLGSASTIAYRSVRAGWRDYLAHHNHGRGVVLIGHSQGTAMLTRLIHDEIDRRPRVRKRLVSAILLGGNVTVRAGRDAGGDFRHVRACRASTQVRCVIAFSTFDEPVPENAVFGRANGSLSGMSSGPAGGRYQVLCTNPAALRGGSAPLDTIVPSAPFAPGTTIAAAVATLGMPQLPATTPWVSAPGAYAGHCSRANGASVLQIVPQNGAPLLKPSPDASWGLHLVDANIALGDLVRVVDRQIGTYAKRRR